MVSRTKTETNPVSVATFTINFVVGQDPEADHVRTVNCPRPVALSAGPRSDGASGGTLGVKNFLVRENGLEPAAFFALTRQKNELHPGSGFIVFVVSVIVESAKTIFDASVNVESEETSKKYDAGLLVDTF